MLKSGNSARPTADEIADMADAGEDISRFFTGNLRMVYPHTEDSIPVRLSLPLVQELDLLAIELKMSREGVVEKMLHEFREQRQYAAVKAG